jgi:hypothetical protein
LVWGHSARHPEVMCRKHLSQGVLRVTKVPGSDHPYALLGGDGRKNFMESFEEVPPERLRGCPDIVVPGGDDEFDDRVPGVADREGSLRGARVVGLSQVVDRWASGLPGEAGEASEAISPYRRYPRGRLLLPLPLYLEPEVPIHLSCFTKAPRLPRQHHELLGLKPREASREASPRTRHWSPSAYPVKPSSANNSTPQPSRPTQLPTSSRSGGGTFADVIAQAPKDARR